MEPDRPAPGRLELVRHVLNSDDRFHHVDHSRDVESLNGYLARIEPRHAVDDARELAPYRTFRETVRALLVTPTAEARRSFNDMARAHPMTIWIDEDGSSSLRGGTAYGRTALDLLVEDSLMAVHEAMLSGQWSRLRFCQRFDCSWIYYDATPGTTMRWCSTDPCGNVMKTRAYRARRAAGAATTQ